jgi:hypothetical protein
MRGSPRNYPRAKLGDGVVEVAGRRRQLRRWWELDNGASGERSKGTRGGMVAARYRGPFYRLGGWEAGGSRMIVWQR